MEQRFRNFYIFYVKEYIFFGDSSKCMFQEKSYLRRGQKISSILSLSALLGCADSENFFYHVPEITASGGAAPLEYEENIALCLSLFETMPPSTLCDSVPSATGPQSEGLQLYVEEDAEDLCQQEYFSLQKTIFRKMNSLDFTSENTRLLIDADYQQGTPYVNVEKSISQGSVYDEQYTYQAQSHEIVITHRDERNQIATLHCEVLELIEGCKDNVASLYKIRISLVDSYNSQQLPTSFDQSIWHENCPGTQDYFQIVQDHEIRIHAPEIRYERDRRTTDEEVFYSLPALDAMITYSQEIKKGVEEIYESENKENFEKIAF